MIFYDIILTYVYTFIRFFIFKSDSFPAFSHCSFYCERNYRNYLRDLNVIITVENKNIAVLSEFENIYKFIVTSDEVNNNAISVQLKFRNSANSVNSLLVSLHIFEFSKL